jgi:transposase-like protein
MSGSGAGQRFSREVRDGQEKAQAGADHDGTAGGWGEPGNGKTVGEVSRDLGISEKTYYPWRKEFGGLKVDQARHLKELERENVTRVVCWTSPARRCAV